MAPLDYNNSLDRLAGWWAINTFYERSSYEYIRVGSGELVRYCCCMRVTVFAAGRQNILLIVQGTSLQCA